MVPGRMRSTLIFIVVSCFLLVPAFAQGASMKLLTPKVGWVLHYPGLMWTTDGGSHWKNITPPISGGEHIASVFFRNTQDGWALLSGPGDKGSDEPRFDLAVTNNAGAKWSIVPVVIPELNPKQTILEGSGQVDFVDPMHGWLNLDVSSSPNFRLAMLIKTDDGGETWSRPPRAPGVSGDLSFINEIDGWLAGGPGNQFLYVTHDGSKTWKKVSLNPPTQVGGAVYSAFASAPLFVESNKGFVPVNYSGPAGVPSKLVIYATSDAGRTWSPVKVLDESRETSVGQTSSLAITDSILIVPTGSAGGARAVKVPLTGGLNSPNVVSPFALSAISFADAAHGWAMADHQRLLSTDDGGKKWTDVTPHPPQRSFPPAKPPKWRSIDPLTGRPTAEGKPQAPAPSAAPATQPH